MRGVRCGGTACGARWVTRCGGCCSAAAAAAAGGAYGLGAAQVALSDILEQFASRVLLLLLCVVVVGGAQLGGEFEERTRWQRGGFVGEVRDGILIDAVVADLGGKQRSLLLQQKSERRREKERES